MDSLELNVEGEKLHSEHVSEMCEKLAGELNLDTEDREKCKKAGKYHDIGKSIIDKAILDKSEPLSAEEWHLIKQHSENGYRLLSIDPNYRDIAEYVLQHHERWDGKGYPKGLKGEEIQYISRIIAICDSYDAMTSNRPYRRALSDEEAIKEIIDRSGSQFDPNIAKVFIEKVLRRSWN
jgi:HD-GYP domain-containing protein (c-di-GMP phosphodiesterase class II)